jgi:hypothetical protein
LFRVAGAIFSAFAISSIAFFGIGPPASMSRNSVLVRSPAPGSVLSGTARIASEAVMSCGQNIDPRLRFKEIEAR